MVTADPKFGLEDLSPEQKERLLNYVRAYQKLSDMPARDLVNLALEYIHGSQLQELLVEELCTRVYPNWNQEDPCPVCGSMAANHIEADDEGPCRDARKLSEFSP